MTNKPEPLDAVTVNNREYWPLPRVLEYVALGRHTFATYVTKGQAPAPAYKVGSASIWDAETITEWVRTRPGKPGRPRKKENTK